MNDKNLDQSIDQLFNGLLELNDLVDFLVIENGLRTQRETAELIQNKLYSVFNNAASEIERSN